MAALPSGRVTFWMTDVEGSTRLWETAPAITRAAMARHVELLRTAAGAHRGHVVKDTGDGILGVFASADEAVAAAVDGMIAVASEPWPEPAPIRVRMGVHTGEAIPVGDDYHGPTVNRVARIVATAHGGQIVVSDDTRESLGRPPEGATFRSLGPHRLRDLAKPVGLSQVVHPALEQDFPPIRSLEAAPHNLPAALSSFVGRDAEVADVCRLVRAHRLVTLTGPGGVGKTRLALQVAAEEVGRHREGVWRVDLSGADADSVASTVTRALGIGDQPGQDPAAVLLAHLRDREALLVLDNCEHVAQAVGTLTRHLLEACPRTRVLATSREPLHSPGEQQWLVAPLASPPSGEGASVGEAGGVASVQLFVDRARSVDPGFRLAEENVADVAAICRRLDGLPLALELAAARVRVLPPAELLTRLSDRFRILGDSRWGTDSRHPTLEATIAWSYEMLDAPTRWSFEMLSVFAGAFLLADAEQVISGRREEPVAPDNADAVLAVAELVDRSLLQAESTVTGCRYRLLESIRAYGRDRLVEHERLGTARRAHRRWLGQLARDAAWGLRGSDQVAWLERVDAALDDVRAGLRWAVDDGDAEQALEIAVRMFRFWQIRAAREGYGWLSELVDTVVQPRLALATQAAMYLGYLAQETGRTEEALDRLDACAGFFEMVDERRGLAWVLTWRAQAAAGKRDAAALRDDLDRATTIFTALDDADGLALAEMGLLLVTTLDDPDAAASWIARLGELRDRVHDPHVLAHVHESLAAYETLAGRDLAEAAEEMKAALLIYRDLHHAVCGAHALIATAALLVDFGEAETAAVLEGAAQQLTTVAGVQLAPIGATFLDVAHDRTAAALDEATYRAARARGRALDYDAVFSRAVDAVTACLES